MRYSQVRVDGPPPATRAASLRTVRVKVDGEEREVQTPHDVTAEKREEWLQLATTAHENVHLLSAQFLSACEWRKQCLKMARKYGARQREIGERLGLSRSQIGKLQHDK